MLCNSARTPVTLAPSNLYMFLRRTGLPAFGMLAVFLAAGCGAKKTQTARVPAPPPEIAVRRTPPPLTAREERKLEKRTPIFVETGVASWYGPPYHNRKAASGEVFDMNALTAAHKTLPLNSIVRVTNLNTGQHVTVRINDRGPFVGDRVIDLSYAAAREIGVWRAGTAQVRLEVLDTPSPIDKGGRWCVQVGAFTDGEEAEKLKDRLQRKYRTAKVISFTGPTGDWVRVRPLDDDKSRAEEVARHIFVSEGAVFLVRLD